MEVMNNWNINPSLVNNFLIAGRKWEEEDEEDKEDKKKDKDLWDDEDDEGTGDSDDGDSGVDLDEESGGYE